MKPQPIPAPPASSEPDASPGGLGGGGRAFGLRAHLIALVVAVLLPALVFGGAASWDALRSRAAAGEARLLDTAQAMSAAVDAHIAARIEAIHVLGLLGPSPDGLSPAFLAAAQGVGQRFGGWVMVYGPDLALLLDTRGAPSRNRADGGAEPRLPMRDSAELTLALATRRPVISNLARDPWSGEPTAFVHVPLYDGAAVRGVIGMAIVPARLNELLQAGAPTTGAVALTDGQDRLVARSADGERVLGQKRPPRELPGGDAQSGIVHGRSLIDGSAIRTAWQRTALAPGWMVWANVPEVPFQDDWTLPAAALAGGGALALAVGLLGATLLSRRMLRPVDALVARLDPGPGANALLPPRLADRKLPVAEFAQVDRALLLGSAQAHEREEEFRAAFECSPVPMSQVDAWSGRLVRVNEAYAALLGRPVEELEGRAFSDFVHPEDRRQDREGFERLVQGDAETHRCQKRYVRPDGSVAWVDLSSALVRDAWGRPVRTVAVAVDITERRAAEEELREGEARLRRVQRIGRIGGFEIDLRTGENLRSPEYMALQGWPRDARTERHQDWVNRLHPADAERAERHFLDAIAPGGPTEYAQDYRIVTAEGAVRWIAARAEIERDADGAALRVFGVHLDITALREAEQGLVARERELVSVLEATTDGVLVLDAGWRIAFLSRRGAELIAGGADLRGQSLWEAFPGLIDGPFWDAWHRTMLDRVRTTVDGAAPQARGAERAPGSGAAVLIHAACHPREDGGIVVFLRDVTFERTSAARLAAVLDSAPVGVVFAEAPQGRVVLANRRAEAILGASLTDESLGRAEADAQQPLGLLARALRGEDVADVELRRTVGHEARLAWFRCGAAPVRDRLGGGLFGAVLVLADVDAERRAAAALAESEQRLRLALEAGEVGTFEWDLATGALVWDARMRSFWGVAEDAPIRIETAMDGVHPDDREGLQAVIQEALDPSRDGLYHAEHRVVANGTVRHLSAHGRVEFEDGRPVRMLGTGIDVTTTRRAAELLAREADLLEQLAERRGQALAQSEARLAEAARMEALGRLAGGIAHDVNNVLQAVQSGLRLAARRLDRDPADARRYLALAESASERGSAVTRRLLSFARRGELRAEAIQPAPLLRELALLLGPTLGPDIELEVEACDSLPPLAADRSQLESVLVNLANNARDAMEEDGAGKRGGKLRLVAELPHEGAEAAGLPPGEYLRIEAIDTGRGMSEEVLARVTEPFFTTKPLGQGTGLGLAMARAFAEQSGGALSIRSEVGAGTTVSLWLPRASLSPAEQAVEIAEERATQPAQPPRQALVLFVEDEPSVRMVLGTELEELGFGVEKATDGPDALERIEQGLRPDVLLTDLAMPGGLDGLALIETARRIVPGLPAVLLTGHVGDAPPERLAAIERTGAFAVVRKPAQAAVMAERLRRVLRPG